MTGTIFDIQRFSTHDGPGIRTTIFMKGCPLRCFWCHNPESFNPHPEVLFTSSKCIGCGRCTKACPYSAMNAPGHIDRKLCKSCGACAEACPPRALVMSGRIISPEEAAREAEKDVAFYKRSGGGVTVSGGEALMQSGFVAELLRICRQKGIHTAIDTCGDVPYEAFEAVLPYTGLFLYDIKAINAEQHKKGCGRDNRRILENLEKLCESGANIRLRVPVVPGFNDDNASIEETGRLITSLSGKYALDLLRFHRMGAGKYDSLNMPYPAKDIEPPGDTHMLALAEILKPYCTEVDIK